MEYTIKGEPMPVVICELGAGESMITESGAMSWMSDNMQMETNAGGIGKAFGRMFSGEKMFRNVYTAVGGPGMIAFASSLPGAILKVDIDPSNPVICQKSSFLASTSGIDMSVHFQKKFATGFFGGEGFIMQKLSGTGTAFIEIDGSTVEYDLKAGERLVVDTGYLAMADASVGISVESVKGMKNMLFGGEGLFNTVLTGPGKVILQTKPINQFAAAIASRIPSKG